MRREIRWALSLVLVAAPAYPISFGIFSDPDCASCNSSIAPGTAGTFYVRALPGPIGHLVGAELRVVGLPSEWIVLSITPNPRANVVIGDLMGTGTNIAFAADEDGSCIDLFAVRVFATTAENDIVLRVTRHATPSNPLFQCPVLVPNCWRVADANPHCFTLYCASGGSLFVNATTNCTVESESTTWSRLKRLYE